MRANYHFYGLVALLAGAALAWSGASVASELAPSTVTDVYPALPTMPPPSWAACACKPVESLIFTGLKKTDESYLRSLFDTRVGLPFDPQAFLDDLQRIRDWEIFQVIEPSVNLRDGHVVIVVRVVEKWTITPVIRPKFGGQVLSIVLGVRDTHLFGLHRELAVYGGYRQRDILGQGGEKGEGKIVAGGWYISPRNGGGNWGYELYLDRDFFEDPIFTSDGNVGGVVDRERWSAITVGKYEPSDTREAGVQLGFVHEANRPIRELFTDSDTERVAMTDYPMDRNEWFVTPFARLGRVRFDNEMLEGADGTAAFQIVPALGGDLNRIRWTVSQRAFALPTPWLNLGYRFLGRLTTAERLSDLPTEGGFANFRGYPDRYLRAQGYVLGNAEARIEVIDWWWLYGQFKLVYDAGWFYRRYFADVGYGDEFFHGAGFGIYGTLPFMHNMKTSIDFVFPLSRPELGPDLALNVVQFF